MHHGSVQLLVMTLASFTFLAIGCTSETEPSGAATHTATDTVSSDPAPGDASSGAVAGESDADAAIYRFTLDSLAGDPVDLAAYKGKTLLIVNTASKCGRTPQYEGLQKLHETYADRGLAVLGFPANNFGGQEPGTDQQIAEFCEQNYGVQFDMFSKISVKGDDQHPLFTWLTAQPAPPAGAGDIKWNFEKFLISPDGQVIAHFRGDVKPDAAPLIAAIERQLGQVN